MKFHFWGFDSLTWVISLSWLLFWLFFPGLCHRILIVTLSFSLSFLQPLSHSVQHLFGCHSIEKRTDRVLFSCVFFLFVWAWMSTALVDLRLKKHLAPYLSVSRFFIFFFLIYRGFQLPRSWILQTPVFFCFFLSIEYCPWLSVSCFSLFFFFIFTNKRREFFFVFVSFFLQPCPSHSDTIRKTIVFFFRLMTQ